MVKKQHQNQQGVFSVLDFLKIAVLPMHNFFLYLFPISLRQQIFSFVTQKKLTIPAHFNRACIIVNSFSKVESYSF